MGTRSPPPSGKKLVAAAASRPGMPPISSQLAQTRIIKFMTRNPRYATATMSVGNAIKIMLTHGISGLPVVDDSLTCIGLYSELDAMLQAASQPLSTRIRFKKPAISVTTDMTFKQVLLLIAQKKVRRVPVLDNRKKLVGLVARRDLLKAFMAERG